MLVAPLHAGVVHRAEDERKDTAYINRRQRLVQSLEANLKIRLVDPVIEQNQKTTAYDKHDCCFKIRAFLDFPEHAVLTASLILLPAALNEISELHFRVMPIVNIIISQQTRIIQFDRTLRT